MATWGPIIAIALAAIAAGSIAVIAWELSSDDFHKSFEPADDDESDVVDDVSNDGKDDAG